MSVRRRIPSFGRSIARSLSRLSLSSWFRRVENQTAVLGLLLEEKMKQESASIRQRMKTPRAAAIAGIIFSCLLTTSLLLIWASIPANPFGAATDVIKHSKTISFAFNLVPFAGIAFLWFIAVLRDRLGELEDRFFATVFLGSGLLFTAMIFTVAAIAGGIIRGLGAAPESLIQSGAYLLGRAELAQFMHIYAMKMAAVFMITTSTISLQTRIVPRWIVLLGFILALILLLSVGTIQWIPLLFPVWVLLISIYILIENLRRKSDEDRTMDDEASRH